MKRVKLMSEKYLKEIAKELKLIRKELQKYNGPKVIEVGDSVESIELRKYGEEQPIFITKE